MPSSLSAMVSRLRAPNGAIPLVASYDIRERVWNPPMPLLFQRSSATTTLEVIRGKSERPGLSRPKREGWLGEVEWLQVSLSGAKDKIAQIDSTLQRKSAATDLGMPSFY